jgi:hypothetical protein
MVLDDSAAFAPDISHWWPIAISTELVISGLSFPLSI